MPVTIKTIADRVGVSKQAVSYALNGKPGQVSEETRERIVAVAKAMGYQPNWRARSFARQRSQIIGLVYGRPAEYLERSQMVSALVERLAVLDYELLLIPAMGPMAKWSHKLRDGRVDGVLITHPMPLGLDAFVAEHRMPAVFMNLRSSVDVPQVYFDDTDGTRQAMEHLLGLGHRRITYYSTPKRHGEHYSNIERELGYRDAMRAAGLADQIRVVVEDYEPYAEVLAAQTAEERPTALLVYNDFDALRLTGALAPRGIKPPVDFSLATFSEDPRCPLTCVYVPSHQLASEAVGLLMGQVTPEGATSSSARVLSESLVVRDSTSRLIPRP